MHSGNPLINIRHFDDFSWGDTRKVDGETKGDSHSNDGKTMAASCIPLKRWDDWERERRSDLLYNIARRRRVLTS